LPLQRSCQQDWTILPFHSIHMLTSNSNSKSCTTYAGVELGGSLKNVLAIACGISDGLGYGNNGRAALITRGLGEISRIALKQAIVSSIT